MDDSLTQMLSNLDCDAVKLQADNEDQMPNNLVKLTKKIVRVSNLNFSAIDKTPNLVPSIKELKQMQSYALAQHRLENILYWIYNSEIAKLTFKFTGDKLSPPLGTYSSEPDQKIAIPFTKISTIVFKTWHDGYNYSMNYLSMLDADSKEILKI